MVVRDRGGRSVLIKMYYILRVQLQINKKTANQSVLHGPHRSWWEAHKSTKYYRSEAFLLPSPTPAGHAVCPNACSPRLLYKSGAG